MKGRNLGHTLYRRTSIWFIWDKKDKEKIMDTDHRSWHEKEALSVQTYLITYMEEVFHQDVFHPNS